MLILGDRGQKPFSWKTQEGNYFHLPPLRLEASRNNNDCMSSEICWRCFSSWSEDAVEKLSLGEWGPGAEQFHSKSSGTIHYGPEQRVGHVTRKSAH